MSPTHLLIAGWQHNLDLAERLYADIPDHPMTSQPGGLPNHPAWTLAHLLHYHPAILALARGETVSDPGEHPDAHRYDAGSTPVDDPAAYPPKAELLDRYRRNHDAVAQALRDAPADRLDQQPGLARWVRTFPTTGAALQYLMVFHEAQHLGEVTAWRRPANLGEARG